MAFAFVALTTLTIVEVSLRAAGFAYRVHQNRAFGLSPADENAVRIVCLGESTTANGGRDSYPSQLERVLNERGGGRRFRVFNEGLPGRDTATIASRLLLNLERYRPQAVVTMMGINDRPGMPIFDPSHAPDESAGRRVRSLRVVSLARVVASRVRTLASRPAPVTAEAARSTTAGSSEPDPQELNRRALGGELGDGPDPTASDDPQELAAAAYRVLNRGEPERAESLLRRAVSLAPGDARAQFRLGELLCGLERFDEGAATLERARALDPRDAEIGFSLANCYREGRRYDRAEPVYRATIALAPTDPWPRIDLAIAYTEQHRFAECETTLEEAIAASPTTDEAYLRLADCHWAEAEYREAIGAMDRLIAVNPRNDRAYGQAARSYQALGDAATAARYLARANQARLASILPATVANYRWIARTLHERGVRHVAVQYPARPRDLLEAVLGDAPDVAVVDDEAIFKDAIDRFGYDAIFENRFAGDFGHGTARGNRILAENVAATILAMFP